MLRSLWHSGRPQTWAELDELLSHPDFAVINHGGGAGAAYRRLHQFACALGPAREVYYQPDRLLAGMEWAGIIDPALMHAAMVHYGVCGTALREGADPHNVAVDELAHRVDSAEAVGTIVATEAGRGGSQMAMRTEAHYDREQDVFRLHTPTESAVKFMPNVGHAGTQHVGIVTARLYGPDGVDHGVHAFAVPLPYPGVDIRALPGGAPVDLDYAAIRFTQAVIPRGYWLARDACITQDGHVEDLLSPQQRLGRSLAGVGTALVSASVALHAVCRSSVAITARFLGQRLLGGVDLPVGRFSTHHRELASALARTTTLHGFLTRVRSEFMTERLGTGSMDQGVAVGYGPWVATNRDRALSKVAAGETAELVTGMCRRLCGVQGVLYLNRLAKYEDMARSFHAAGGDNRLLLLEAGKQLATSNQPPPATSFPRGAQVGDPASVRRLLAIKERALSEYAAHYRPADEADPFAWNPLLPTLDTLGRTHLHRRVLDEADEQRQHTTGTDRTALDAALRLHATEMLLDDAGWHLNYGTLRPGDLDALIQHQAHAVDEVHQNQQALLDGMAIPPGRVGAWIGRDDYIRPIANLFPPRC